MMKTNQQIEYSNGILDVHYTINEEKEEWFDRQGNPGTPGSKEIELNKVLLNGRNILFICSERMKDEIINCLET